MRIMFLTTILSLMMVAFIVTIEATTKQMTGVHLKVVAYNVSYKL